ncbi:hypothetical protein XPR_2950, partial [Xanthomonas arboricola pv. pruni MAFF 301420]
CADLRAELFAPFRRGAGAQRLERARRERDRGRQHPLCPGAGVAARVVACQSNNEGARSGEADLRQLTGLAGSL